MTGNEKKKAGSSTPPKKDRAAEIANTFEWLITAFILAFVFRAFVMEAFRIPTGSMADTLMGAHFRLSCPQCGYKYDHGFIPQKYRLSQDTVPSGPVRLPRTRCPNCGYYPPTNTAKSVVNGDRILVLKCIYQFFEPKRWDVIVFKDPPEPQINYIKRLIALPGETIQIIDGDIYINGQIIRKSAKVQNELWMPTYNNDYQPVRPAEGSFNGHIWSQPFKNTTNSSWKQDKKNPTAFHLNSTPGNGNSMFYDTSVGNDFRGVYAYDDVANYKFAPYCSDLKIRFYFQPISAHGTVGGQLSKYETTYKGWVDYTDEPKMVIAKIVGKQGTILASKPIEFTPADRPLLVEFENVDHQLIFKFGQDKLTYDLGTGPDDAGSRKTEIQPEAMVFGSGKLTLSHIAIFRDIHYLDNNALRATQASPFTLGVDEFFVLGDNTSDSADSRYWNRRGRGNNERTFNKGVVPREYLVGKAMFVYWPGGFKLSPKSRFGIIPNIGEMRLIYGGSKEYY